MYDDELTCSMQSKIGSSGNGLGVGTAPIGVSGTGGKNPGTGGASGRGTVPSKGAASAIGAVANGTVEGAVIGGNALIIVLVLRRYIFFLTSDTHDGSKARGLKRSLAEVPTLIEIVKYEAVSLMGTMLKPFEPARALEAPPN